MSDITTTPVATTVMEVGYVRRGWVIVRPCGGLLEVGDFEVECDRQVAIFAPAIFDGLRGERYLYDSPESLVEVIGVHHNLG